jgi:uncharacterized protein (TIGR02001 family)
MNKTILLIKGIHMKSMSTSKRVSSMAVATALSALFVPAFAQAQVSYNIGMVSLYKSSGSDADEKQADASSAKNFRPALQGGVDFDFGNGFYVGNWNSTGKFGGGDGLEIDLYGGYSGEITKDLSYDLNLATYIYPGAVDGTNGSEAAMKLTYQFASIKYVRGLGDYDGNNKVVLGAQMALTDSLSVSADYHITNNNRPNGTVVAVSYDMGNALTASATISGTDNDSTSGKTRLVFGLSKGF